MAFSKLTDTTGPTEPIQNQLGELDGPRRGPALPELLAAGAALLGLDVSDNTLGQAMVSGHRGWRNTMIYRKWWLIDGDSTWGKMTISHDFTTSKFWLWWSQGKIQDDSWFGEYGWIWMISSTVFIGIILNMISLKNISFWPTEVNISLSVAPELGIPQRGREQPPDIRYSTSWKPWFRSGPIHSLY